MRDPHKRRGGWCILGGSGLTASGFGLSPMGGGLTAMGGGLLSTGGGLAAMGGGLLLGLVVLTTRGGGLGILGEVPWPDPSIMRGAAAIKICPIECKALLMLSKCGKFD